MKKTGCLVIVILVFIHLSTAQKQHNKWYFGSGGGLDFNTTPPTPFVGNPAWIAEGSASVSDSCTGNILFYITDSAVWDRNNNKMPNGLGLSHDPSSIQATMIVPAIGAPGRYYIFATNAGTITGFTYSEVDMSLNGGLGDVVAATKNTVLCPSSMEGQTATLHSNCKDIWVINHDKANREFRAFLVTSAGVNPVPVISIVGNINSVGPSAIKVSNFGEKIIMLNYSGAGAELFDFNRTTGIVSNPRTINNLSNYSAAFSPDDNLFYIGRINEVLQYETNSANIPATQVQIGTSNMLMVLQLGPDCRIYISPGIFSKNISVINNPNSKTAPGYVPNAIPLAAGTQCVNGLPNFLIFQPCPPTPVFVDSVPICSKTAYFRDTSIYCPDAVRLWNFGDPTSGTADTSSLRKPIHTYSTPGTYNVTLILKRGKCLADTIVKTIVADTSLIADAGNDTNICKGATININGGGNGKYYWSPTGDTTASITVSPTSTTTYRLIVTNNVNTNCNDTDYVTITVDSAVANAGTDRTICVKDPPVTLTATGGGNYNWNIPAATASITVSPVINTTYTVTVTVGPCTDSDEVTVTVNPLPTVNIGKDTIICSGKRVVFDAGSGFSSYLWQDGKTSSSYSASIQGVYIVFVTDSNNCTDTDTALLKLINCDTSELWVPNAFTPNSDGNNDVFKAEGMGITKFQIYIYDRWGEMVFESNDINIGWDGTYGGDKCQDGVYSWIIFYEAKGKGEEMKVGRATLIH